MININNMKLETILTKEKYHNLFNDGYLPELELMDSGQLFIKTITKYSNGFERIVSKFIFIDKEGNLLDEYSTYSEIPKEGYLIRLDLPSPYLMPFMTMGPIVDINNINIFETRESLAEGGIKSVYSFNNSDDIPEDIMRKIYNDIYNTAKASDMFDGHIQ